MVNTQRIYNYLDTLRDTLAEKLHLFVGKRDGQIGLIFSDCFHTYKLITLDESGEVITINGPVKENFAELVEEMYRLKNGADVLSADDAPVELCGEVLLQLAAIAVYDEGENYEYLKEFVNRDSVKEVFGKKKGMHNGIGRRDRVVNTLDILKDYIVAELSYTIGDDRIHINLTKKNGVEEYIGCITFGDKDELIFHGEYENYLKFKVLIQKGLIIGALAEKTKWESEKMEL